MVKVAINGFGRIGRLAFRQMFGAEGYEVVAINDLTNPAMLAHLLKYDSAQGRYALADKVTAGEDSITVDGKTIKIYAEKDAKDLPWVKSALTLFWNARASIPQRQRLRLISTRAQKRLLSPLLPAMICPQLFSALTKRLLQRTTRLSLLLPVRQTAWLPWLRLSTTTLLFRAVS